MINYTQDKDISFDEIKKYLEQSAQMRRFSNDGPVKSLLETKLHSLLGLPSTKRVLCTSSGTSALHTLMFLFEKKIGNHLSWVTIAYNFPSAVVNGFNTTVVDIEASDNSYSIPLNKIYPHDGFILPTLFGTLPSNFQECLEFCKEKEIILILDNASSPLTVYQDKNICDYSGATFGSLHQTKYLGCGEGGFLVLPKEDYHAASAITNFGFLQNRKYHDLSSNFKMSDIAAAFILSHINHYNLGKHQAIQSTIVKKLAEIKMKPFGLREGVVYGNLPIAFPKPTSHLSFRDQGIEANKYYRPLLSLHNSNQLYDKMINFPLHSTLTQYEIGRIIEQIGFHLTPPTDKTPTQK